MSAVYPPSDLKDFLRCPQYRAYKREGLEPLEAEWTPNLLLGKAIGEGLTWAWRRWGAEQVEPGAVSEALRVLDAEFEENPRWDLTSLTKMVQKGIQAALEASAVLLAGQKVVAVDEPLGSGARPDLVLRDQRGLTVIDAKVTLSLDSRREVSRLNEQETDDQYWHYGWEAGEFYGVHTHTLGVLLIPLQPKVRAIRHLWPCEPERLAFWLQDAEVRWTDMEAERLDTRPVTRRFSSCQTKYGPCPYYLACHSLLGDKVKMVGFYQRTK